MSLTQIDLDPDALPAADGGSSDEGSAAGDEVTATIDLTGSSQRVASGRPQFTITEAAAACAVSRKTITRKLTDLAEHGGAKDEDGVWRIPVEALLAVGLHPGRSLAPRQRADAPVGRAPAMGGAMPAPQEGSGPARREPSASAVDLVTVPRDRWDDLRIRLARAEAEAAERALALADARLALRALTAGPAREPLAGRPGAEAPPAVAASGSGLSLGHGVGPRALGVADALAAAERGAGPSASGQDASALVASPAAPGPAADGWPPAVLPAAVADAVAPPTLVDPVVLARTQAAQSGGYVPAASGPPRKRRWWQARDRA